MQRITAIALVVVVAAAVAIGALLAKDAHGAQTESAPSRLTAVWISGDPDAALKMGLMYAHAAKRNGWFDEVSIIIWGPSQKLFVENAEVRTKVLQMMADGVKIEACIACANLYNLGDQIREHGIDVKGMGVPLSEALKAQSTSVLSF